MYLSYNAYVNICSDVDISESDFATYSYEAENLIDYYTYNRLKADFPDTEEEYDEMEVDSTVRAVQRCMVYLIGLMVQKSKANTLGVDTTNGAPITSQSNDGLSTSYNVVSASQVLENCKTEAKETILQSLSTVKNKAGRKVTYRGLYAGE